MLISWRHIDLSESLLALLVPTQWLEKLGSVSVDVPLLVHAGRHVERHLAPIILSEVISLVVEISLEIAVFELFVRCLAHRRSHGILVWVETCQISTEAVEALLVKEAL